MMLTIFGIAFELPLLFVLLNLAGVLPHERFRKWRRMIIFCVFAFAAVFTPARTRSACCCSPCPCVILVELAEVFAWAHDRRKARRGPQYPGLAAKRSPVGLDAPADGADVGAARGRRARDLSWTELEYCWLASCALR